MERTFLPMSCWAAEDIPSNKIVDADPQYLSNAELLSIILGVGSKDETALDLARRILADCDNNLRVLGKKNVNQLTHMKGVGKQKAAKIMATLELARRKEIERMPERCDLGTATRIYNYMFPYIGSLEVEEFWCLYLNQNYKLLKSCRISHGGITETAADLRIIMREAVLSNCTVLAVCHNHPSGKPTPSKQDDDLTKSIEKACTFMRIHFLDHVIVTEGAYYSYHEQGMV